MGYHHCFRHVRLVFLLCIVTLLGALSSHAADSRVFWSPDGQKLGVEARPVYRGSSHVIAMIKYGQGVLTAFDHTGNGYRIHWSPDGGSLGSGEIRYDGSSPITAMIAYRGGVLVAFSNAGGNGNRIWFSPDGYNLGAGQLLYDGSSPVTALAAFRGGVLAAFSNAGGNGNRIWFSADGKGLGGGQLLYDGSSPVTRMLPFRDGVLTAFANAGPYGYRIHWSADGNSLGGGAPVYDGSSPVTSMIGYQNGVLVAFGGNAGSYGNAIYFSPNGDNLGIPRDIRYDGSTGVSAMLSYNGGVFTAFVGEEEDHDSALEVVGDFFDKQGRWITREAQQVAHDIGNTPESWTRCLRDVEGCAKKNFNKLLTLAVWPAVEAYRQHLYAQVHQGKGLPRWLIDAMRASYPDVDLGAVAYAENINTIHGQNMTWGANIFFTDQIDFANDDDVELVLHELEHVGQYARRGGFKAFLSEYVLQAAAAIVECQCVNAHDSVSIERAAIAKASQVLSAAINARDNAPETNALSFKNSCNETVKIAVRYQLGDNTWRTAGYFTVPPGGNGMARTADQKMIKLRDSSLLFQAYSDTHKWEGSVPAQVTAFAINVMMREIDLSRVGEGYQLELTCNS